MQDPWPMVGRDKEIDKFKKALLQPGCQAFLVTGAPGVGRTRLADECLLWAAGDGRPVARAIATRETASLPLGALAHLLALPPAGIRTGAVTDTAILSDAIGLFSRAREALGPRRGNQRLVLFVDDLNLLDAVSLALLGQLMEAGDIFLLATFPTSEPLPDVLHRMWTADRAVWVELSSLTGRDAKVLLTLALGSPVTADTAAALWSVSRGNVLYLRELVLGAMESGALGSHEGVWRLGCEPLPTSRLQELVADRIRTLDPPAQAVLEHLAVCGPAGASALTALAPVEVLERLERSGLVQVRADGRRRPVALAHPLYAQAIRDGLPQLTVDRILGAQIAQVSELGARRLDDTVKMAIWQLEGGGQADPDLLVRAARLSRSANDFPRVERLARAALTTAGPELAVEAATLLGEALGHLGRIGEAEEVFALTDGARAADGGGQPVAPLRALNLTWGSEHPDQALAVIDRARHVLEGQLADELDAVSSLVLTLSHRPREAYHALAAERDGFTAPPSRIGSLARVAVLAALGRTREAVDASDATPETGSPNAGLDLGVHPVFHVYARVMALYSAGLLTEAISTAERGLEQAIMDNVVTTHAAFSTLLGRCHLTAGRPRTAIRWFRETAAIARTHGLTEQLRLAYAGLAMAHAFLGDAQASRDAVFDMGPLDEAAERQGLPPQAYAWHLAVNGERKQAIDRLLAASADVEARGELVLYSTLLHDVARLGEPERVADRLAELAGAVDSPMVTARAWYAAGSARLDPVVLDRACTEFGSLGAWLYAAEAAAQAQRHSAGTRERAARAVRITGLLRRCESARTPALLGVHTPAPLSLRERDVCLLAAQGLSSREIAARLVLSVRTVDNYLQRAYAKLGISRRGQLTEALELDPGSETAGVRADIRPDRA
ncbi:ATP-binding protein [Microtetraspora fusca]|uniref:LuxR C-terminal-related transcriptional regulator n=1 Tax=Microtetraspora fusca TaxID=1997 RepID=A0ABW6V974_MICFU|nr:LuxR family transcriptional regulator [Microtetraspora fusca]